MHDIVVIVIFVALLGVLALEPRFDLPRRADQVVGLLLTVALIFIAFELGDWAGTALLLGTVAVVEMLRITRKRKKAGT